MPIVQSSPILIYSPGTGSPAGTAGVPASGYLYYWPSIDNLTGGQSETDLDAQNIAALPSDALVIVITGTEGETHWLRTLDEGTGPSAPVTDVDAGMIVPVNYDSIVYPYVLVQQFGVGGVVVPPVPSVGDTRVTSSGDRRVTITGDIRIT